MKLLTVIGARPQFIKAAVVSKAINEYNKDCREDKKINEIIIHTGQHYDKDMADIFFRELNIPRPSFNLGIGGLSHGAMTGRMIEGIERIIIEIEPNVVMVYGDTDSTLAGALAAAKARIPIAHVEAGLRSFNKNMPEEINRIVADHLSTWLLCPTETAVRQLDLEGIMNSENPRRKVINVGDVMYDAVYDFAGIAQPSRDLKDVLTATGESFFLATVHRAESTDDGTKLRSILSALEFLAAERPVLLPLHPRTAQAIKKHGLSLDRVRALPPVGYFDMLCLLKQCSLVLTDSGGLQKEANFLRKPCVILRPETEWVELVESGSSCLAGTDFDSIISATSSFASKCVPDVGSLFGSGEAGKRIVKILAEG